MATKNPAPRTCRFESLEGRKLMAADIVPLNGVLNIMGTVGNDQIEIAPTPNNPTLLTATVTNRDNGNVLVSKMLPKDSVQNLVINNGEDGDDVVLNSTDKPSVTFGSERSAWRARVVGGSNRDVVFGARLLNPQMNYDMNPGDPMNVSAVVRDGLLIVRSGVEFNRLDVDEVLVGNGWGDNATAMLRLTAWKNGTASSWYFEKSQIRHLLLQGSNFVANTMNNRTNVPATMFGDYGNDTLTGGSSTDLIFGGTGWDKIYGGNGNDILKGGDGRDFLYGEGGADQVWGELGDDELSGGGSNDQMNGTYDDSVDFLSGGAGRDTYHNYYRPGTPYSDTTDWFWAEDGLLYS